MLKRIIKVVAVSLAIVATASATPKRWSKQEAAADAEHDIDSHKIKICLWGGYAPQPVGIPDQYWRLIRGYPTRMVGQGCIVSDQALDQRQREYAETYNARVLSYILKNK
jgi:hypothetical protein